MHSLKSASLALLILALTTGAAGQGFKPYPGVTKYTPPDTQETREVAKALPPGTTATIYTTNDSFEKVVAFYKSSAKEYQMPGMRGAASSPPARN